LPAQEPQTQADDYTRYELLDPASHSFRIHYHVSATRPGATHYFNSIRAGSEATVHGVQDLMTGASLEWDVEPGDEARRTGHPTASLEGQYIKVTLARSVPPGGEVRIRIDKTYRDPEGYGGSADGITFSRSLGIDRNAVVLPPGYELTGVNYPSQIGEEADGRIRISLLNRGPSSVPLRLTGRKLPPRAAPAARDPDRAESPSAALPPTPAASASGSSPTTARIDFTFSERAFQDREIVYYLEPPETHSFRLYHDYTESRPGVDRYLNVVRAGSRVSDPSARVLDTGQELPVEMLRGDEITARGIELSRPAAPSTEVVVVRFDPVEEGQSVRLRIEETYTDPGRYLLARGELIWDRNFGRPRNTLILPGGWFVTANSIPAVVSETEDGRIELHYVNDRPDGIQVFVKAKRR
jgi:hypothetical protein